MPANDANLTEREAKLQREALAAGEPPPSAGATALAIACVPLRIVLAGVFLFAAWQKMHDSKAAQIFSEAVQALWKKSWGGVLGSFDPLGRDGKVVPRALPDHLVQLTTFGVPWVEIVAAALLIVGLWTRSAAAVILMMLLGFTSMYIAVILRHEDVNCGCFGKSQLLCTGGVGWCHVGQNLTMAAMALIILLSSRHILAVDRKLARRG